jgi:hypothetical protein
MLGRDRPAASFPRQMPEQRLTAVENGVGHFAIVQDGT